MEINSQIPLNIMPKYLIIAFLLCHSCKTIKKNNNDVNREISNEVILTNPANKIDQFMCDGKSYSMEFIKKSSEYPFVKCLSDSIYIGKKQAIEAYLIMLDKFDLGKNFFSTMQLMNIKLRGNEIFKKLLAKSNVFECYFDSSVDYQGHYRPYHEMIFERYTSMIRTIDGNSVQEYLNKNIFFTLDIQIKMEDEDKCKETLYKLYYNAIKQAYEKGLVRLKDFGEE